MCDWRNEVHEDERGDGLEVEADPVDDAAVDVGVAEPGGERLEVHHEGHRRQLHQQRSQTGVELKLSRTAKRK